MNKAQNLLQGRNLKVLEILHVACLLTACAIFAFRAFSESRIWWLNPDEGIYYSVAGVVSGWNLLQATAAHLHPPLYYICLILLRWLGAGILECRVFSILCMLVFLLFAYQLVKEVRGLGTALLIVVLLSCSPALLTFASLLRPYALQLALLTGSLLYFSRLKRGDDNRRDCIICQTLLALACLTHYSSILFAVTLFLLWSKSSRVRDFEPILWALGVVVVFNLQFALDSDVTTGFKETYLKQQFVSSLSDLVFLPWDLLYFIGGPYGGGLWLALLLLGAWEFMRSRPQLKDLLVLSPIMLFLGLAFIGAYPAGGSRHNLYLVPLLMLSCCRFSVIRKPATWPLLLALVIGSGVVSYAPRHPQDEERLISYESINNLRAELRAIDWSMNYLIIDQQTAFLFQPLLKELRSEGGPDYDRILSPDHRWILGLAQTLELEVGALLEESNVPARQAYLLMAGWDLDRVYDKNSLASPNKEYLLSRLDALVWAP